jgi:RHS repeat-associated protein
VTDVSGSTATAAQSYDAFGAVDAQAPGSPNHPTDLAFAGAWGYQTEWSNGASEPGLGLDYLQQRYYDPAVGRFISPDPIGFAGGQNLYRYAEYDPVSAVDPSGLDVYVITWGGGLSDAGVGSHAAIAVDWPGSDRPKAFDFGPGAQRSPLFYLNGGTVPGEVLDEDRFYAERGTSPSHPEDPANSVIRVPTGIWGRVDSLPLEVPSASSVTCSSSARLVAFCTPAGSQRGVYLSDWTTGKTRPVAVVPVAPNRDLELAPCLRCRRAATGPLPAGGRGRTLLPPLWCRGSLAEGQGPARGRLSRAGGRRGRGRRR